MFPTHYFILQKGTKLRFFRRFFVFFEKSNKTLPPRSGVPKNIFQPMGSLGHKSSHPGIEELKGKEQELKEKEQHLKELEAGVTAGPTVFVKFFVGRFWSFGGWDGDFWMVKKSKSESWICSFFLFFRKNFWESRTMWHCCYGLILCFLFCFYFSSFSNFPAELWPDFDEPLERQRKAQATAKLPPPMGIPKWRNLRLLRERRLPWWKWRFQSLQ